MSQIGRVTKRRRYRGYLLPVTGKTKTPQQGNRQDTYLRDKKERESNNEQENMCVKTKGNNIAGVEKEKVDLHINNRTIKKSFGTSGMYNISLARWKIHRKNHRWSNKGKVAANNSIYYCVSVNLTVLRLFRTPQEAVEYFNRSAWQVKNRETEMLTTVTDHDTI